MQQVNAWFVVGVIVLVLGVAGVQWWVTRALHLRRLAAVRERHQSAQQAATTLLQQARAQTAQIQQELAAAREAAAHRAPAPAARAAASAAASATANAAARERLHKLLDEAPASRRALPVDGFADTLPSQQFASTTSFGLLQRSSAGPM